MEDIRRLKKDLLDRLEDDDDIKWKPNPFGVEYINEEDKTPKELMSKITWFWDTMFLPPKWEEVH